MASRKGKPFRKFFRERLEWPLVSMLVRGSVWVIRCLPYGMVWWLARLAGGIAWLVPSVRRLTIANIRLAIPELDAARVGRQSMTHLCATFLESFWMLDRPDRLAARVDLGEYVEMLRESLEEGGCVMISPHLGNWELGHQRTAQHGIPASCVAQKQRNPGIEKLFTRMRSAYGGELIHEQGAVRKILKNLASGRFVGMLIDQNTSSGKGGVFVPFFGLPAFSSRAPAVLLRRTPTTIIVGYMKRLPDGQFVGRHKLIAKSDTYESDEALLLAISEQSEAFIREAPEQYLWMYRKWRHVPENATPEERARYPFYARETGFTYHQRAAGPDIS